MCPIPTHGVSTPEYGAISYSSFNIDPPICLKLRQGDASVLPNMSTDTDADDTTQVAIACQGGGSHTVFTAGVLKRLFQEAEQHPSTYDFVALSGTSGGAVCAAAAWYGLLADGECRAIETLDAIWKGMAATSAVDRATNDWLVKTMSSQHRVDWRFRRVPMPYLWPSWVATNFFERFAPTLTSTRSMISLRRRTRI